MYKVCQVTTYYTYICSSQWQLLLLLKSYRHTQTHTHTQNTHTYLHYAWKQLQLFHFMAELRSNTQQFALLLVLPSNVWQGVPEYPVLPKMPQYSRLSSDQGSIYPQQALAPFCYFAYAWRFRSKFQSPKSYSNTKLKPLFQLWRYA